MSRLAVLALSVATTAFACAGCGGNHDKVSAAPAGSAAPAAPEVIAAPMAPAMGAQPAGMPAAPAAAAAGDDDRFKLKPEEGNLAIDAPADAKAGAEAVAKITVTPGKGYHVNTEYPIKLTLTPQPGVALAKSELVAGGRVNGKGDADALDEKQLVLAVKLTPAASGSYTINGSFKFAVCDKDQCLAKKETIAIAVAAK